MKILAVSDEESKYLWDHYDESKLAGVDLILSCGDLSAEYLSFLVTLSHAPVLYVRGTTTATNPIRLMAVSVSKIRFIPIWGCAFWAWAAPCATITEETSTARRL